MVVCAGPGVESRMSAVAINLNLKPKEPWKERLLALRQRVGDPNPAISDKSPGYSRINDSYSTVLPSAYCIFPSYGNVKE